MPGFRLVEAGISGGGPLTLARVYPTVDDACSAAERMLDQLEQYPHRRPWAYRIVDVDSGELVTTIRPPSPYDPDPFPQGAAGPEPHLPFAEPVPGRSAYRDPQPGSPSPHSSPGGDPRP